MKVILSLSSSSLLPPFSSKKTGLGFKKIWNSLTHSFSSGTNPTVPSHSLFLHHCHHLLPPPPPYSSRNRTERGRKEDNIEEQKNTGRTKNLKNTGRTKNLKLAQKQQKNTRKQSSLRSNRITHSSSSPFRHASSAPTNHEPVNFEGHGLL